jgi:hypothetical protein
MLPVCESIFLSGDEKGLDGSAGQSSIVDSSYPDKLPGRNDSKNLDQLPALPVGDLVFQPFGPSFPPGRSGLQNSDGGPFFQVDVLPPDYYTKFYCPLDYYLQKESTGTE